MTFRFSVGQIVQYSTGVNIGQNWCGRVTGREWYEDASGTGEWYYVRWINPSGQPERDTVKLHATEIEEHG